MFGRVFNRKGVDGEHTARGVELRNSHRVGEVDIAVIALNERLRLVTEAGNSVQTSEAGQRYWVRLRAVERDFEDRAISAIAAINAGSVEASVRADDQICQLAAAGTIEGRGIAVGSCKCIEDARHSARSDLIDFVALSYTGYAR